MIDGHRRACRILTLAFACCAGIAGAAQAQSRPVLRLDLNASRVPEALISVLNLLSDRVHAALQSGFPLYVHYRVELRESRELFDRTAADTSWEYVALFDPMRERFVVEGTIDGREELTSRAALQQRLERVYVVGLVPDGPGRFYYRAMVEARTLSDQEIDEAFAWLQGEEGDSVGLRRPDAFTRATRRLLVRVAPLPQFGLEAKSRAFRAR
ncbi:MAG: DUF4390 domain-containing protein [Gemmatimonadetes bacterium]|nr:DUF4390 domain-containing protein [Gemmatimonadota bacterium]